MAESLLDLTLRISAQTEDLKKGISNVNSQLDGVKSAATSAGKFLAGAFTVTAILGATKQMLDFANQVGEATNKVRNLTGAIGKELSSATAKVMAIADTFDQDFNGVLTAANGLSKQMGITLDKSLGLIQTGLASAGINADQFLDIVKEYPSALSGAGISAEEFIAVASQSLKDGTFSDKGIDAVKEFGLRLREMTPAAEEALATIGLSGKEIQNQIKNGSLTSFEALKQVSTKLNEFGNDSKEVGTVLADLFGGAGEDVGANFIKSLATMDTSLEGINMQLDEGAAAQLRLSEATSAWNEIFTSALGGSSTGFTNLKSSAIELATKGLSAIIDGAIDIINYIIDMYNESIYFRAIIQQVVFYWKTLFNVITLVAKNIVNAFSSAGDLIKAVFTGNFDAIPGIYANAMKKVLDNTVDFGKQLGADFVDTVDSVLRNKPISLITKGEAADAGKNAATEFNAAFKGTLSTTGAPAAPASGGGGGGGGGGLPTTASVVPKVDTSTLTTALVLTKDLTIATQTQTQAQIDQATFRNEQFVRDQENAAILTSIMESTFASIEQGGNAFKSFANAAREAIKGVIKALVAQGITAIIAKSLGSAPGPIGVALAAAAGSAAAALFNAVVPKFASGGSHAGGLAIVGEKGPELVNLPKSQIFSNKQSQKMLAGSAQQTQTLRVIGAISNDTIFLANQEASRRRGLLLS